MRQRTLVIAALALVLFSTLDSQKEEPFKHIDGILKIYRDSKGIAHVVADSKQNLYYGLGYA